jgi:hypothetical protein
MESLPKRMLEFLENNEFLSKIRKYNAAFSFISFNATTDPNLSKNSVFTLRIQGQIHHRIGPLIPTSTTICNAATYFKDENEHEHRLKYSPTLNPFILMEIQAMLLDDCKNPFVLQFKRAASIYKSKH